MKRKKKIWQFLLIWVGMSINRNMLQYQAKTCAIKWGKVWTYNKFTNLLKGLYWLQTCQKYRHATTKSWFPQNLFELINEHRNWDYFQHFVEAWDMKNYAIDVIVSNNDTEMKSHLNTRLQWNDKNRKNKTRIWTSYVKGY